MVIFDKNFIKFLYWENFTNKLTKCIIIKLYRGGNVTKKDFNTYKAYVKEPINVALDENYRILSIPPPSSGVLIGFIMRIMRGINDI